MTVDKLVVSDDGLVRMRKYRLWVNDERTLLVRIWDDQGRGQTMEVATRPNSSETWGPPQILTEEVIK